MKRFVIAMFCSSALLVSSGAVLAQTSGAMGDMGASGTMGMKDSGMASDTMASGAMGKKQHSQKKHHKKQGMSGEQPASGGAMGQ